MAVAGNLPRCQCRPQPREFAGDARGIGAGAGDFLLDQFAEFAAQPVDEQSRGAVYLAVQRALDRAVAIKLLPIEVSADADFADHFVREARAMAKLSHPHIIAVHDFGKTGEGQLYIVMEYVDGGNLHERIHGAGLAPADQVVTRAMQQEPRLRYQSTQEMKTDVDAARTPLPNAERGTRNAESKTSRTRVAAIVAAGLVLVSAGAFFLWEKVNPSRAAHAAESSPALQRAEPSAAAGRPDGLTCPATTTALPKPRPWTASPRIVSVSTTWAATSGSGARIGSIRSTKNVCCAVRHG